MANILILGANSDAGKALAKKYASAGYDVYLADKNPEPLNEIAHYVNDEYGIDAHVLKFDPTEFYNHRNFYTALSPEPTGIICAVDYPGDGLRAQKDFLEAKRIMDNNYTGLIALFNIIANDFEERGSGFIIAIGYTPPDKDEQSNYIYKSSKDAFISYVEGLKSRFSKSNISVLTAKKGLVKDDTGKFAEKVFDAQQKGKEAVSSNGNGGGLATMVKGLKWK